MTMKQALLVIDMQCMPFVWKDYGGPALWNAEALLENAGRLIARARENHILIIYVMHTESEGSLRAKGQPLWQVHPALAPKPGERLLPKYHADAFYQTELDVLLKEHEVARLILCGVQTEYCVDTTCRSAFAHGYRVTLAGDAHSTFSAPQLTAEQIISHHNNVLSLFAEITDTDKIAF